MKTVKVSRRMFLKNGVVAASSTVVLPFMTGFISQKAQAEDLKKSDLVKADDPNSKVLQYCEDAEKDSKGKSPKCAGRADKTKSGQTCQNCQLYSKAGSLDGKEVGRCPLFSQKIVPSAAWCASWAKKA